MPDSKQVVAIYGEGKTDLGVVPVFVHQVCDRPDSMEITPKKYPVLQKKSLWQKVHFEKQQAYYSKIRPALVFVVDTEGDHPGKLKELQRGRDFKYADHPTAVGVAHPCIEAWLLADASAIARAMKLNQEPALPEEPESLPAPCKDRAQNPKTILGRCKGLNQTISAEEATKIAQAIRDLDTLRKQCPLSFAPFAEEIERIIKPLFETT